MFYFDMDGTLAKFMFGTPFQALYKKNYFLLLPPQLSIVNTARKLNPYILSAYLEDRKDAVKEKKSWNRIWLPEVPEDKQIYIPCGASKGDFYQPGNILVDDRTVHCKEWEDAGGVYVKVSVNAEDAKKEKLRHRFVIHPEMTEEEILNVLLAAKHAEYKSI